MALSIRHLLGLEGVPREDISTILDTAATFREILKRPIPKVPTLRGKTVVNLFYEPSTRTRISFELAEKRLSADSVNFSTSTSSVKKGETLRDTIRNIEAMNIDMVVVRHKASGVPFFLTQCVNAAVINAGDGMHEHPTQALLDMMTIRDHYGSFEHLKVAILGDIAHSRVARSNIYGLKRLGAKVRLCGPQTLMPLHIEQLGVEISHDLEDTLAWADVVNVLRIQLERQNKGLFPSVREYRAEFGLTRARVAKAKKDLLILHPGPMNRGLEIDSDVADSKQAVILDQVTNGVAVRMAVLYLLSGNEGKVED